jgi:hypothetical protein
MPEGAVYVGRPSKWGNPYDVRIWGREEAIRLYPEWVREQIDAGYLNPSELRGRDLACWCPLNKACHADDLLSLVNSI